MTSDRPPRPRPFAPMLLVVLLAAGHGAAAGAVEADADVTYRERIAPLLTTYCASCHGHQTQRADLNLEAFGDVAAVIEDRDRWELVGALVENGEMPPAGAEPRPTEAEAAEIAGWVEATLSQVDCNLVEPGSVTIRRLNRDEYNATVRDLLAVDVRPADDFPADDVGYGFDHIGDVLTLDPLLLEKYLAAAEEVARRAIDVGGPGPGKTAYYEGTDLRDRGGQPHADRDQILASAGELAIDHDFPTDGHYLLRARVSGQQAGREPVKLALRLDGRTLQTFDLEGDDPTTVEIPVPTRAGRKRFAVAFLNDYYNTDAPDPMDRGDRNLVIHRLEVQGPADPVAVREVEALGDEAGGHPYGGTARALWSNDELRLDHDAEDAGEYRIRVVAFGQQAGPDPARLGIKVDGETVDALDVPATEEDPGTFEARVMLSRGRHRIALAFLNDYYNQDHPDEGLRGDRNLVIDRVEVVGPVVSYYKALPESHRRIIAEPALSGSYGEVARASLRRLANRAFRRPATPEEVERLVELYRLVRRDGGSFEEAMRVALQAILVSPHFLYRVEVGGPPGPDGVAPLTDWELASRLSYFLWGSMPDEALFRAAFEGTLRDPAELGRQALRMLGDPKAGRFIERFAGQWLQLRNLDAMKPDPDRFPEFDDGLREAMRRETLLSFEAVVRENRSVLELLDARETFLNERLARHYGIDGVSGDDFRRVALPSGSPRGGVLTQASILTITSNPTRTSPVKRGKYILDQILGTPIPPPPPDVPELAEGPELTGTLRQRMEQHSTNPGCASCHTRMDPLGFGFENFDAIGRWRDRDGEAPVDASGRLPGGEAFAGPSDLKALLLARKDEFVRTLAEHLMTYALGRGLEYYDRCAVDRIAADLGRHDYRAQRLIVDIVTSDAFRARKAAGGTEP